MDAKEAARKALQYVADLFGDEDISNLGLEEIVFREKEKTWNVTVGFSRPWDYELPSLITSMQRPQPKRQYKVVVLDDEAGRTISVKNRTE